MRNARPVLKSLIFLLLTLPLLIIGCSSDNSSPPTSITTTDEDGSTSVDETVLTETLDALPLEALTDAEIEGLKYMREEEKLARDVYINLFSKWNKQVFSNISDSEQTHTDAVLQLLVRYSIPDPVGTNGVGVFTNLYLQELHDTLVAQGSASLIDGLIVGAIIEEMDIIDIQLQIDDVVDNQDISVVYENLIKGSRNHLRAFVNSMESQDFSYEPQHLTQQVYDDIINADIETN